MFQPPPLLPLTHLPSLGWFHVFAFTFISSLSSFFFGSLSFLFCTLLLEVPSLNLHSHSFYPFSCRFFSSELILKMVGSVPRRTSQDTFWKTKPEVSWLHGFVAYLSVHFMKPRNLSTWFHGFMTYLHRWTEGNLCRFHGFVHSISGTSR